MPKIDLTTSLRRGSATVDKLYRGTSLILGGSAPAPAPLVASPGNLPGLHAWFDASQITGLADGDLVSSWLDSSGSARNATQGTSTLQPAYETTGPNAKPVVRFDTDANRRLVTAAWTAIAVPNTIFVVGKTRAASFSQFYDGIVSTSRHTLARRSVATEAEMFAGAAQSYTGLTSLDASHNIIACLYNSTGSFLRVGAGAAVTGSTGTHSLTGLTIGNRFASTFSSASEIAEIIVVRGRLVQPDIEALGQYLADKYNLPWTERVYVPATLSSAAAISYRTIKLGDVLVSSDQTWKATQVREPGPIIEDPAPTVSSRRFLFPYSGHGATNNVAVGLAFSASGDRSDWTDYASNPVISLGEDPYIARDITTGKAFRDANGLHMFSETKTAGSTGSQLGINHHTSLDGVTWTADPANPVVTKSASGWDSQDRTSPIVFWDGTEFTMVFEGRMTGDDGQIGVARSSTLMGASWAMEATNPVITRTAATWANGSVVPDDIIKDGSTWALVAHGRGTKYTVGRFSTTAAPAAWVAGSFAEMAGNPFDSDSEGTAITANVTGSLVVRQSSDTEMTWAEIVA